MRMQRAFGQLGKYVYGRMVLVAGLCDLLVRTCGRPRFSALSAKFAGPSGSASTSLLFIRWIASVRPVPISIESD